MEISPIPGIRAVSTVKAPSADTYLSRVLEAGNSLQAGDDRYTGSGKKAAGGQDDEQEELEDAVAAEPQDHAQEDEQGMQIDFFA